MPIKSLNKDTAANCEVNMTPLIDVSLVLVVMLILATPLAFESRIDVSAAAQTGREAKVETPSERIEIIIESNENVRVNQDAGQACGARERPRADAGIQRGPGRVGGLRAGGQPRRLCRRARSGQAEWCY